MSRTDVPRAIGTAESSTRDEELAGWFTDVRRPHDSLYVMCGAPAIYALADADPPHPALWFYDLHYLPGAQERMRTMLAAADRPTFIIAVGKPSTCGLKGADAHYLDDHYRRIATVRGKPIYVRRDDDRAARAWPRERL
jgi:hypothetical protein